MATWKSYAISTLPYKSEWRLNSRFWDRFLKMSARVWRMASVLSLKPTFSQDQVEEMELDAWLEKKVKRKERGDSYKALGIHHVFCMNYCPFMLLILMYLNCGVILVIFGLLSFYVYGWAVIRAYKGWPACLWGSVNGQFSGMLLSNWFGTEPFPQPP